MIISTLRSATSAPELQTLSFQHLENDAPCSRYLPARQEAWVQSLGQEDPLEKGMETNSTILAWRIPWTEEPGGPQTMESQRVGPN